jgi:hypothetical protein
MWQPRRLTTLWTSTAYYRDRFALFTILETRNVCKAEWEILKGGNHLEDLAIDGRIILKYPQRNMLSGGRQDGDNFRHLLKTTPNLQFP